MTETDVLMCPICRRRGWYSGESIADHVDKEHGALRARCTKRRYRTSSEALEALISANRKPRDKRREHRRYECTMCGGWHLTSMPAPS